MDSVIAALAGAAPQLGQLGVLVLVLGLLIRREAQTNKRHASELERVHTVRDAELRGVREQVDQLRAQLDEVNRRLDAERAARRAAEDAAGYSPRHRRDEGGP